MLSVKKARSRIRRYFLLRLEKPIPLNTSRARLECSFGNSTASPQLLRPGYLLFQGSNALVLAVSQPLQSTSRGVIRVPGFLSQIT
ncbi:MAG: hypothetical protein CXZ00_04420 [Acidobacteria bacterium]|nr:MAG: hypothetical protein CXZ00_04420 [Acidobacteriota bacterium]